MKKDKFVKPHIVYFQQNLALGACEEYLYLLMQGIDKLKFNLSFVCPGDAVLDSLATNTEKLGIKVYRYSFTNNNYIYFRSFFRELKPDIIHFNDPCLVGIIAARLAGVPILLMTHHTPELDRQYNLKGRFIERIALRHCGIYSIFTSEFSREAGISKDKISRNRSDVIYYGLPLERFNQRFNRQEIYAEFSLDEKCHIIGNIARLNYQKGQRYLIEAASLVIEKFKSVKFFFVGEGELELELKARVKERGIQDYVVFTGHRTDIPRLLSAFELLVMPSLFEGLCFAVIEAEAMGIPVIATSMGGLRRSVVDGKTGILIPPKDPKALANAIIWMLEHPKDAKEMGLSGQAYFREMFTQDKMVRKTEGLYENLLLERE